MVDKVVKAALVIQKRYRGYRARLKAREYCALAIFQSLEYADEQRQMQLSSIFSFMLENYTPIYKENRVLGDQLIGNNFREFQDRQYNVEMVQVPQSYNGPRLKFPFTFSDIDVLIRAYKNQQVLHAHYVLEVLFETKKALKKMPNLTYTNSSPFKDITICGDLHGHLDDLLLVFHKMSGGQKYSPVCHFVGTKALPEKEVRLYGFSKEVLHKYKVHGRKILEVLEEVYSWLPVGTIIDKQILVVHGGISESTDLNLLNRIQRSKLKSVLMPPLGASRNRLTNLTDSDEEIIDLLWSDPKGKNGCYPNTSRGGGCYFGPDVTAKFLNKYHLKMIIRSHECKPDGYDICHDGKVITVFSASNYYEDSSNRGAYIKLVYGMMLRFFQYRVAGASCLIQLSQRIHTLERSTIRILKAKIISRRSDLISAFYLRDYSKSGKISVAQWAFTVENTLGLNLPWRALSPHLVNIDSDGNVDYMSCFEDVQIENSPEKMKTPLIETMYRYRSDLKLIFNLIHCDHSGLISMKIFLAMWKLFSSHYSVCIDDSQIDELANTMDLNEFFKTFYVVHKHDKLNT
ncbi:PREDICTED: serine/threonine-protein phosphatase with EF-hands 1-like [Dipodomys ordii]|uniref:protein-serine/threonine phosphatase n=1 Tax=Dipodomys ordii TaxID=10020 RepID=A0A1S3G0T4_DIPOR|nr:PREDICTED: serine/threonine-protein phosphatase with EF-hands 1-like [Dipodomys ordii]